ncbi:MAG: hypothetical protein GTO22_16625, partial [Gemmatimonadales bacterium]|nr:hypothetical protein [Gemmatimonadales bacterium]
DMVLRRFLLIFGCLLVCQAAAFGGVMQMVSVSTWHGPWTGEEGDNSSKGARISPDGRFVVFTSRARNLVGRETGDTWDVFVHNRVTRTTEQVSPPQRDTGAWGCHASDDGRYVAFATLERLGDSAVFVYDRLTGATEQVVSRAEGPEEFGWCGCARISADGRYVSYESDTWDIVNDDLINPDCNVFVYDRITGTTERVGVGNGGQWGNPSRNGWISGDGRYVAFQSCAANLVPGDTNGDFDAFVRDRVAGTTELVSVTASGQSGNQASSPPVISPDGRYLLFGSWASDLVPGDTNGYHDVFVHDRVAGTTELVSVSSTGDQGTSPGPTEEDWPFGGVTADGRYVVFASAAVGLAPGDSGRFHKVFLRDRVAGTTEVVSVGRSGEVVYAGLPSISADGRCIAFCSPSHDLVPADTNETWDVFVWDADARFHDVPSCFWAFGEIEACVSGEVVHGYLDNTYRPEREVTRDQMAVYISRALAGGEENVPEFTGTPSFPDVPEEFWALDHVEYAVAQNVVEGYHDGTYGPQYKVSRAQMAVYVARALVAPTGEAALADYVPADPRDFSDVPIDFWSYKHVEYCVENGVVAGYLDGLYHPEIVVTRDQMAVYVARAFDLPM